MSEAGEVGTAMDKLQAFLNSDSDREMPDDYNADVSLDFDASTSAEARFSPSFTVSNG
jgi:hypothetical protein